MSSRAMWTEAGQLGDGMPGRSCYLMEDAECGSLSPDLWREPPLPDKPEQRERRARVKRVVARAAFKMPGWDEATQGPSPFPFYEQSPGAVAHMSDDLRASYEAEKAAAADPRSGPRLVPYVPLSAE